MGWTYSNNERQPDEPVTSKSREATDESSVTQSGNQGEGKDQDDGQAENNKTTNKEGGNHLEQDSIRQTTIVGTDGGLRHAVDGQRQGEA